jgi:hypothetical protein
MQCRLLTTELPMKLSAITNLDILTDVRGFAIEAGHYWGEQNPDATTRALLDFFATD